MQRLIIFVLTFIIAMLAVMGATIYVDMDQQHTHAEDAVPVIESGLQTAIQSLPRRLTVLQAQASHGDAEAQFWVGLAYAVGWGVPRDFQLADYYLLRARQNGHLRSNAIIAMMYLSGIGRKIDYTSWQTYVADSGMTGNEIMTDPLVEFLVLCQQENRQRFNTCDVSYGDVAAAGAGDP